MTNLDTSIFNAPHTKPIQNPTEKQIEGLQKINLITKEKVQLRNNKCDKYFEAQTPPKNYKDK